MLMGNIRSQRWGPAWWYLRWDRQDHRSEVLQPPRQCSLLRPQLRRPKPGSDREEFRRHLAEHSLLGSALTMRNYQARRPSLLDFEAELEATQVPE
jgi:hypothetical protein